MADGLLGSFDNVMAGLTADDIDALDESAAPASSAFPAPSADAVVDTRFDTGLDTAAAASGVPAVAPHRVVDSRAQEVADRLLRRTRPLPDDAVVVPDRPSAVPARLVVIVDGTEAEFVTIDDGDTLTIGRGEAAQHADPMMVLVPYGVVSRQHCTISRTGDTVSIADAGSANGTVIVRDGQMVGVDRQPVSLLSGDVVATAGGHRPFVRFHIERVEP